MDPDGLGFISHAQLKEGTAYVSVSYIRGMYGCWQCQRGGHSESWSTYNTYVHEPPPRAYMTT